jgi:hypothetical protein
VADPAIGTVHPERLEAKEASDVWMREELLHLLSLSGTLAGLCVTVVALMHSIGAANVVTTTIIDDLFALCALVFLVCTYLIFWALRVQRPAVARLLIKIVDGVFLGGLTTMTAAAFMMVYTVW